MFDVLKTILFLYYNSLVVVILVYPNIIFEKTNNSTGRNRAPIHLFKIKKSPTLVTIQI